MNIWSVYYLHKDKEYVTAVVITDSETEARRMVGEKYATDLLDTSGRDWFSDDTLLCKCIGAANQGEERKIVMFQKLRFLSQADQAFDRRWTDLKNKGLVE